MRTKLSMVAAAALSVMPMAALATDEANLRARVKPESGQLLGRLGLPGSFAWRSDVPHSDSESAIFGSSTGFTTALSPLRLYPPIGRSDLTRSSQLFEPEQDRVVSVTYAWRSLKLEGTASETDPQPGVIRGDNAARRFLRRATQLSYQPLSGLTLRFSRGTWNSVDQLMSGGEVKRSSLSASYTHRITGGEWQTVLAWGRNSRKDRESLMGYLAQTSIRFAGSHLAFGRLEQVGIDDLTDLAVETGQQTKLNKLSVGYYHDLHRGRAGRVGLGIMASRHLLPASTTAAPQADPVSYMLFMRVNMH